MKPRDPSSDLDLASQRRDYGGPRLLEADVPGEPIALFTDWLKHALSAGVLDATAMGFSTCSPDGQPSSRMVLLKGHDARGFVFYTRYSTQKCVDLLANPRGALLFHWRELDRQVRIEGELQRLSDEENQAYFASRPRPSQLSARAASGLTRVPDAAVLEERFRAEAERWDGKAVPMPEDWGGFRLKARRLEFWQGRPNRLHDRLVYELGVGGSWSRYRLAP